MSSAAHAEDASRLQPERALAEKYAPIVRLQAQAEPCGPGEPFQPTDVERLLASDEVAFRGPWDRTNLLAIAPTARGLGPGRSGYHLDFPGDPLRPGCDYERWARRLAAASEPVTYARVALEPGVPGWLALQYWLFYPYNDFNNKHEGDWEMIQLVFEAGGAEEALGQAPVHVGYSQHEGAEHARWGDPKLELSGGHPVVYAAAGSHANYFEPGLFLGRTAAQGVGCDDTTEPSRDVAPRVVWLPTAPDAAAAAHPWLGYDGHWGEKLPGFYDGPTGPNAKRQWREPIGWARETWRERSFAIVGGGLLGPRATDFFCDAVEGGSGVLLLGIRSPPLVAFLTAAVLALALWVGRRTAWRPSAPLRLARRRAVGQMLAAAARMYARHARPFLGIGVVFVPLGVLAALFHEAASRLAGVGPAFGTAGEANTLAAAAAFGVSLVVGLVALVIVQAACARMLAAVDAGRSLSVLAAYRAALALLPTLAAALVGVALPIALLSLSGVGIPVAAWWLVRCSLVAQVVALEGRPAWDALRRSGALVRGRLGRAAALLVAAAAVPLVAGPLVGALLLVQGDLSLAASNAAASLVYAIAVPYTAIATAYLYFDLRVRDALEPIPSRRDDALPAEV